MNSFIIRALSALAAVLIVGGAYYWGKSMALGIMVAIAIVLGSWEIYRLLYGPKPSSLSVVPLTLMICGNALVNFFVPVMTGVALAASFVLIAIFVMLSRHNKTSLEGVELRIFKALVAILYVGIMPSYAAKIVLLPQGEGWFFALLLVVFAGDIGAYVAGSLFGSHTMMPALSPKKSWEGSLGGILFSLVAGVVCLWAGLKVSPYAFMVFCLFVEIAAQQGDFFESLIKRIAQVKDSGTLMPGHGGVLDRLDGIFFAAPLFYLFAWITTHGF
jgi:phosphatidate cytidylyltransferase